MAGQRDAFRSSLTLTNVSRAGVAVSQRELHGHPSLYHGQWRTPRSCAALSAVSPQTAAYVSSCRNLGNFSGIKWYHWSAAAELMERLVGTMVGVWLASQEAQGTGHDDIAQGPIIPEKHGVGGPGMQAVESGSTIWYRWHQLEVRDPTCSPHYSQIAVWPWHSHSAPQCLPSECMWGSR